MSGGVDPTCDISLPNEEAGSQDSRPQSFVKKDSAAADGEGGGGRFLSLRQLNALAIILALAASGMVSMEDLGFVAFSFGYMQFICLFAFPPLRPSREPRVLDPRNPILRVYVLVSIAVGLILPAAYILEGIAERDNEGVSAAASHLFLLASQVFMEGVAFSSARYSLPVQVFVPVFYNSRRIFTTADWLRAEVSKAEGGGGGSARRVFVGRALAVANMAFWSFNLFGVLLPIFLPRAFKRYYSGNMQKE